MNRWLWAWIGGVVLMALSVSAQTSELDAVLMRAGVYVVEFQRRLSGVVAEETYVQEVRVPLGMGNGRGASLAPTHRELKSDLLLVKPVGGDRWSCLVAGF